MGAPTSDDVNGEEGRLFEVFFRTHYGRVVQYVGRRVPTSRVDDVVAATFVVAWKKFRSVDVPSLPWLFRIASFEVKSAVRTARRSHHASNADLIENLAIASPDDFDGSEVRAALSRLSVSDQELLRLVHWDDLTRSEAAEVLGTTINAVNVRYHRALNRLERQMAPIHANPSCEGAPS
jgi:RNA polymerase sigma-70 factor (ECF subfamily)